MGHYVKVATGQNQIELPDGGTYDDGDVVLLTDEQFAKLSATAIDGSPLLDLGEDIESEVVISIPIDLTQVANGDVVTNYPVQAHGTITAVAFVVTVPVTTAAKLATLNLEIGNPGTNVTGGIIALTSANATPLGKVLVGTAITANNTVAAGDVISVEASAVTAFAEGKGVLLITIT